MDFEQIKELVRLIENSSLTELDLQLGGDRVRLCKSKPPRAAASDSGSLSGLFPENNSDLPVTIVPKPRMEIKEGVMVHSPIVGTYYESPSPKEPPFVKLGDAVRAGDVLCIVEAMKVMNEITCKTDGVIAEILAKNESMVEYNQPLYRIVSGS